jgi:Mg2+ and Co2+ transporter CorA
MWILDDERIVTAFPQRWQQPKNDPLNLLNAIMDDINSKTREPVRSVYDLSMAITERCSSILDDRASNLDRYQFFKMFESSIGIANDREANLFIEFNNASMQASSWLERSRKTTSSTYEDSSAELESAAAVDKLLYIGQETSLLTETKDIRDELNMMSNLFNDQMRVIPAVQEALCEIFKDQKRSTHEVRRRFGNEMRRIETRIKDLERMDKQTARIYSSILDMLDLKQKHAANTNVFEARFAREQAEGSARQNQILMVFTIVTIVFLPLSFIAAFFTINIQEFQSVDGTNPLTLKYVSKWVFGVGFAVAIPMVILALNLGRIVRFFAKVRMLMTGMRKYKAKEWDDVKGVELDLLSLGSGPINQSMAGSRDGSFRIRQSWDIESGR